MEHLQKKSVMTPAGEIYYFTRVVSPSAPTAVLLHGLSANHTTWVPLAEALAEHGINSVILDLRGHGNSDKTKKRSLYTIPTMCDDLERIVEKEHLVKFHIVGYSFGGWVALDAAIRKPKQVQTLTLISTNHVNPLKYRWWGFVTPIGYVLLQIIALLFFWQKRKKYYYFDQQKTAGYWQSTFTGFLTMPISINLWMLSLAASIDYRDTLRTIQAPTLLLYSAHDAFVTQREIRDMRKKIPRNETVIIHGANHFLASQYQQTVTDAVVAFIHKHL